MSIKTKDVGLRLRIERDLREQFVETCRAEGKPAAHVLREYMRAYISSNRFVVQKELDFLADKVK